MTPRVRFHSVLSLIRASHDLPEDGMRFLEQAGEAGRFDSLMVKLADRETSRLAEWIYRSVQAARNLRLLAPQGPAFDDIRKAVEKDLAKRAEAARFLASEKEVRIDLIEPGLRGLIRKMPELAAHYEERLLKYKAAAKDHSGSSRKQDPEAQLSVMVSEISTHDLKGPSDSATAELLAIILNLDSVDPETVRKRRSRDSCRRSAGNRKG